MPSVPSPEIEIHRALNDNRSVCRDPGRDILVGSRVAVCAYREPRIGYGIDLFGKKTILARWPSGDGVGNLAISPSGTSVCYSKAKNQFGHAHELDIVTRTLKGSALGPENVILSDNGVGSYGGPDGLTWLSEDKILYYRNDGPPHPGSNSSTFYELNTKTKNVEAICKIAEFIEGTLTLSPDHSQAAFPATPNSKTDSGIHLINLESNSISNVTRASEPDNPSGSGFIGKEITWSSP